MLETATFRRSKPNSTIERLHGIDRPDHGLVPWKIALTGNSGGALEYDEAFVRIAAVVRQDGVGDMLE
jgi:hypothetical protein